jgi:hypothetical protein
MADVIERPLFTEGDILRSEDLNAAADQSRARDARHARQAHRWGIVVGLDLVGSSGPGGFEITLTPGVARDIRGREIVVPNGSVLSPDAFNVSGGEEDWFPVFLVGVDEVVTAGSAFGACGGVRGRRALERYEIEYGRPQEAIDWDQQNAPDVDEGPDASPGQSAPRVLLGFVQSKNDNFSAVKDASPTNIRRRYAGVRGGAFESPNGTVVALVGDTEKEAISVRADGGSNPILTLDRKGNLSIQGTLQSALKGDVKVSSGVASDGVKLPLPAGVKESDVGTKLSLHVFVRPFVDMMLVPVECTVDDQRRVRCRVRELKDQGLGNPPTLDSAQAWPVDYLLFVGPKGTS